MNVVVIAPHPDDEAIGCGGALCQHSARGDRVAVIFLTSGELGLKHLSAADARRIREAEADDAAEILGVVSTCFLRHPDWFLSDSVDQALPLVANEVDRANPEVIYLPHGGEWHPDHRAAYAIGRALPIIAERRVAVRAYEVWTPLAEFDDFVDISTVMAQKLKAVRAYRSQLEDFRYDRAVEGLNQYRGALAGRVDYAEVFAS